MKGYKITKEILVAAFAKTKETSLLVCQDGHVFTKKHASFCNAHSRLKGIKSQEVKATEVDEFLENNKFEETVAKKVETPTEDTPVEKTEAKGTATDTPTVEESDKLQKEDLPSKVNSKLSEIVEKTEAKGTATDTPTVEELEKLQQEELLSKINAKIAEKPLTEMSHKELVEVIAIIDERASAPRSKAECIAIIEETVANLKTV